MSSRSNPTQPIYYQIKIKGHLGSQWSGWFEGMQISLEENSVTRLSGPVIDDAELHGLLKKVRDLGMPLLSVNRIEPGNLNSNDLKSQIE